MEFDMTLPNQMKEFLAVVKLFEALFSSKAFNWDEKFDMVFSNKKSIKKRIDEIGIKIEWYDPDASYFEDVKAYYDAVQLKAESFREFFIEAEMNLD